MSRTAEKPLEEPERTRKMGRPREVPPVKSRAKPENLSDVDVLNLAIQLTRDPEDDTPISDKLFAETVLHCNVRTIRKYRDGRRLPKLARSVCEDIVRQHALAKAS